MTLTLELTSDAEEKLRRKATQRGQKLDEYAQSVLLTDADTVADEDAQPAPRLTAAKAADLRGRLHSFAGDWDRPDMDVYDAL